MNVKRVVLSGALIALTLSACTSEAEKAADTAKDAGNAMTSTAKDAGDAMKDTTAKAGDAMKDTAAKAGDAMKDTTAKAGDAMKDTAAKAGAVVGSTTSALKIATGFASNQGQIMGIQDGITQAIAAVQSGKMADAKTGFSKAQDAWHQFGGALKAKSPDSYQSIDSAFKSASTLLNSAKPDSGKLATDMQGILAGLTKAVQ